MFENYLLISLKHLQVYPVFSAIKILSLTLGLTASILVILHVQYIQQFNKHIPNWENTYRLMTHLMVRETNTPYRTAATAEPYVPQLRLDYPGLFTAIAKYRPSTALFSSDGVNSIENDFHWAEPDVVELFDLQITNGNRNSALTEPNTMLISESTARIYFADEDPVGRTLSYNDQADIRITGVFRDPPETSTTQFEMLISVPTGTQLFGETFMNNQGWIGFLGSTAYLSFPDRQSARQLEADLESFVDRNLPEGSVNFAQQNGFALSLQPISDIYLNPLNNFGAVESTSRKTVLYGLIAFAILIFITSCINYINLSLAQLSQRGKEIGIRKTLGAARPQIVKQFLSESLVMTTLAALLALPLAAVLLPVYTNLTDTGFGLTQLFQSSFALMLVGLTVLTGLISGLIPALALSRLQVVNSIKLATNQSKLGKLSKAIVTAAQFTLSTALILLAIAIYIQTSHLQTLDIGYNRDNLVILDSRYNAQIPESFNFDALINELQQHPGILSLATSDFRPPNTGPINPWQLPSFDENESITVAHTTVSPEFIETYEMNLLAGRVFDTSFTSDFHPASLFGYEGDQVFGIVITDLLARRFGYDSPEAAVGENFDLFDYHFRVIGVISRFQFSSGMEADQRSIGILRSTLSPLRFIHLRMDPLQTESALEHIDSVWSEHRPGIPIDRSFFSQTFDEIISDRTNGLGVAAFIASIVTVLISGFGLYALATYSTLRRTKEIGVRKTLGAASSSIVSLLAWDFLKPVLIASVIAWPLAFLAIESFYAGFSDQADFPIPVYLIVSLGVVGIALLTVSFQCLRSAQADPVQSLRYE